LTHSIPEENYLKAIYHLSASGTGAIGTNQLAEALSTTAASVTEMLKRLSGKRLVVYRPYHGVSLTNGGRKAALRTIRKHRLWELFLVRTLQFGWDEVHSIAEQLEHIQSDVLTDRLEAFLGHPRFDPHGDPIPDSRGRMPGRRERSVADLSPGEGGIISSVGSDDPDFLRQLDELGIRLGTELHIEDRFHFDASARVTIKPGKRSLHLADRLMRHLYTQEPVNKPGTVRTQARRLRKTQ
jgi:DtxR family Mn-dependent transcriptional regulator